MPNTDKPLPVCGVRIFRPYRLRNLHVTPCVREPGHEGRHVYCERINEGMDGRSHSLHYMREITRKIVKPDMVMEMDGPWANETYEECAALYQFMEHLKELRGVDSNNA